MGIEGADLKNESLFRFLRLPVTPLNNERQKMAMSDVYIMLWKVKMSRYWFGCVLVTLFNIAEVFAKMVAQWSSCFANILYITHGHLPSFIAQRRQGKRRNREQRLIFYKTAPSIHTVKTNPSHSLFFFFYV